jgi:hypothetical protein
MKALRGRLVTIVAVGARDPGGAAASIRRLAARQHANTKRRRAQNKK